MEHRLKDDSIHDLMDSRKPLMTSEVWGAEESPRETFVSRRSGCAAISAWLVMIITSRQWRASE